MYWFAQITAKKLREINLFEFLSMALHPNRPLEASFPARSLEELVRTQFALLSCTCSHGFSLSLFLALIRGNVDSAKVESMKDRRKIRALMNWPVLVL